MSKQEIELLQRALDRQVKARKEAEKILESKSKELYDTLHYLREDNNRLKGLLQEKTSELEGVFFNIPDPYLVINLKGQVIKMNQAAKLFLGFDTEKEDFYALQKSNELLNANTTEGKYALEIWKYKPLNIVSDNTVVDPLSLYLSMQDIKDERIEMALDQMLKKYVW